jgi:hypothetical protein
MATIDLGRLGFVNKGTYNNSTTYEKNDLVQFTDGGILSTYLYIDSTAQSGQAPSSSGTAGSRWVYYAKGGAAGTDLGATLNNNEIAFKTNAGALDGLAIGSAGQILKVNSGANGYEFAADAGGNILQIVATLGRGSDSYTNSTSLVSVPDSSISITPSSASSRVWVQWQVTTHQSGNSLGELHAYRGSTDIGNVYGCRENGGGYHDKTTTLQVLDHPNTTSATSYSLYMRVVSGSSMYGHRSFVATNEPRMKMVAMEISSSTQWTN